MGDVNKDLEEIAKTSTDDFYELLGGLAFDAQEADIKKAYRKASIRYHPDKNPDDPNAADKFILLGFARDILIDAKLKGEYDRQRTRRREKALQNEMLDSRRRKMKEDLERREQEAAELRGGVKRKRTGELSEAEKREMEIQRLAEDGKRRRMEMQQKREQQRREEEEIIKKQEAEAEAKANPPAPEGTADIDRTVRVQIPRVGAAATWDKDKVRTMFEKYGKIESLIMGKDKKLPRASGERHRRLVAVAFIVYKRLDHAYNAVEDAKSDYPVLDSVTWAGKEPDLKMPQNGEGSAPSTPAPKPNTFRSSFGAGLGNGAGSIPTTPLFSPSSPKTPTLHEITMIKLKQAEKERLGKKAAAQTPTTPKFSFSPKPAVSKEQQRLVERKKLEEEIRRQDAAEEAAEVEK